MSKEDRLKKIIFEAIERLYALVYRDPYSPQAKYDLAEWMKQEILKAERQE
jgi:hypothetical protein